YAIHSPLQARAETSKKFKRKPAGKLHENVESAACLAELDEGVGRLMQKLAELGLEQNTLVVFTSDNGGTHELQEPLRGKKGCYYEGGIRVPMIVRWPGVVKPGTICPTPVINIDFYATFAALAGAQLPSDRPLDGANLQPLFAGQTSLDRSAIFWHFPGYLQGPVPRGRDPEFRTRPVSVIRKGDWKLHLYHEEWLLDGGRDQLASNRAVELYNIVADPGETQDRARDEPQRRDELLNDLLAWIKQVPAPLPSPPQPKS
ncbi:MAG: sulfatase-like hydrolase/transferase, partial [Planctomycetaceae bacterium]|nr:sulfatase-like hydrolase/transferase [Planctomycetaceae bacterium]